MSDRLLVDYRVEDRIAIVAMNRADKGNAYGVEMGTALVEAFDQAERDPAVRAVVFTGHGPNFCVGADLSGGRFGDEQYPDDWNEPAGLVTLKVFEMNKPVIAAIRGAAVGAGATIVLACDFRIVSPDARFGYVFGRRGIYPEGASAWFLPRLVGLGRALDWMVSGHLIGADEAHSAGLATRIAEDPVEAALDLGRQLADKTAPVSAAVIRRLLFHASTLGSPREVQRIDSRLIASIATNPDALEGVASFFERRDPNFPGRVPVDLPGWLPWLSNGDSQATTH
ncbi:enoyl-CoA hydratase-related protein [Nocardia lijiangensis]|uniref:enoyl-CoA hydratase-related protein n=1 Tax=Nocardia lijiangensis TaxID=299618 RepID=UPI00082B4F1D|nr:enoyl-CoA hydratase-related protein [Nocardia lijiangensis]